MNYLRDSLATRALKIMRKSRLALVPPTNYGTVGRNPPPRRRNSDVRAREYLTDAEINRLIVAASRNRHGHRDATMILIAYRAWPAGVGAMRPAMAPSRAFRRPPACPPQQARHAERAPYAR